MSARKKSCGCWTQRTHLLRADEYICPFCGGSADKPYATCPFCGHSMEGSDYDPSWVDEAEMLDIFFDDK